MRAIVIGGSLGGLFAANLLRTIGWDAQVFERSRSDLKARGAGLGTQPALFEIIRRIDGRSAKELGVRVRSRTCVDVRGDPVCEVALHDVSTAWDLLYSRLRSAFPTKKYHCGKTFVRFDQGGRGVTAHFSDGTRVSGDLLVAADGMRSAVRRQLVPDLEPRYAGYVAWRGIVAAERVPPDFRDMLLSQMVFCFPPGEMALSVPMPPSNLTGRRVPRRCMYGWFRRVDLHDQLPIYCTDASGRNHGVSIRPPLIRREVVAELQAEARRSVAPQIAQLIAETSQPILSPIFDLESPRIVFGRAVVLGDAAFASRPHVGTGVAKAALDAQALVDALASAKDDLDEALRRYEFERYPFGKWLVARGRHLGLHLESGKSVGDAADEKNRRQQIGAYLREYGSGAISTVAGAAIKRQDRSLMSPGESASGELSARAPITIERKGEEHDAPPVRRA